MKIETLKPIILIVESDMMIAHLMMESLKGKYEIHHITEGYSFYEQIKCHHYDLIICNMILSFFSGLELLNILRYQLFKNTPFILLSLTEDKQLLRIPFSDSQSECLVKPFSLETLQAKTQKALSLGQNPSYC